MRCSAVIMEEYGKYVAREREQLLQLPRGAKAWWSRSRKLMQRKGVVSSVPALRGTDNTWVLESEQKADLFADTFSKKFFLKEVQINEYTPITRTTPGRQVKLKNLTEKDAQETLEKLRIDSGTGPDLLPARILKYCSAALAKPVLLLTMCILSTGSWPELATALCHSTLQEKGYLPSRKLPRYASYGTTLQSGLAIVEVAL